MSIRDATYAGYAVLGVAMASLQLLRMVGHGFTLSQLVVRITTLRGVRLVLFLGWTWLGWHLFARGTVAFLRSG